MRRLRIGLLACAVWGALSPAWAQNETDALRYSRLHIAPSATALGLAGAYVAIGGSWEAAFSNPAGLSLSSRSELLVSLSGTGVQDQARYLERIQRDNVQRLQLPSLAYLQKVPTRRGSLAIGIGYDEAANFTRRFSFAAFNPRHSITEYFLTSPFYFDLAFRTYAIDTLPGRRYYPAVLEGEVDQQGEVFERGQMGQISLAYGIEALRNLHFGAALYLYTGQYRYERVFEELDSRNIHNGRGGTTDFESLRLLDEISSELSGLQARLGLLYTAGAAARVGASLLVPGRLEVRDRYRSSLSTAFDNGERFSDSRSGLYRYRILLPARISAGASLRMALIRISAEAEWTDWTALELAPSATFGEANRRLRRDYRPTVQQRLGAELQLPSPQGLVLRGGWSNSPSPHRGLALGQRSWSLGLGVPMGENARLDVAYAQTRFSDQFRQYAAPVGPDPIVYEQVSRGRLVFSLRWFWGPGR
ncbi:MAG: hypothetical protein N2561_04235 [Bacteroidetes bacterium]|nr:hypothetical protein [Rhodothermia bacterium]MCS7154236.1 hypothetical protein [Bacteroidota bacterium]MCX7906728.1 hypothetical protein [Bacteroidota bacterium]MDW8136992.1 hypothetical protein [Bacteroidota bacterium]MDW8285137.1 hypothetical protein [Bacteroidota bacterium]